MPAMFRAGFVVLCSLRLSWDPFFARACSILVVIESQKNRGRKQNRLNKNRPQRMNAPGYVIIVLLSTTLDPSEESTGKDLGRELLPRQTPTLQVGWPSGRGFSRRPRGSELGGESQKRRLGSTEGLVKRTQCVVPVDGHSSKLTFRQGRRHLLLVCCFEATMPAGLAKMGVRY